MVTTVTLPVPGEGSFGAKLNAAVLAIRDAADAAAPAAIAATSLSATAVTAYYVAPFGLDSNSGKTAAQPLLTIAAALAKGGSSPISVNLAPGDYPISAADANGNAVSLLVAGSVLRGSGTGNTFISITGPVAWGVVCLATQCQVSNLTVRATGAGAATYGVGVSTANKTTGSSQSCRFIDVTVQAYSGGVIANAFSVGGDTTTGGNDLAQTVFAYCNANGKSSTNFTNAAFLLGNSTAGNILDTTMFHCTATGALYGVNTRATGCSWFGGAMSFNSVADIYVQGGGNNNLFEGFRSETSASLLKTTGGTSLLNFAIRNVLWNADAIVATGVVVDYNLGGSLSLQNISIISTAATITPLILLGGGGAPTVSLIGLQSIAPLETLVSAGVPTNLQTITALNYSQIAVNGARVKSIPGPVLLSPSNVITTYNGTGRFTAYPVETQTLTAAGAVTISAISTQVAQILLQANATSSSITNAYVGQQLTVMWKQDATGGRTVVWPTNFIFAGTMPAVASAANAITASSFIYDGANWNEISRSGGASAAAATAPNIQFLTASGTYTKPIGAKTVEVLLIGGGGGGGSGRRGATATVRCGGGGGGGGGVFKQVFDAADISATVAVTVPQGGAGGAAVAVDDTSGITGTSPGSSVFGTYLTALSGGGGGGGTVNNGGGYGGFSVLGGTGTVGAGASSSASGGNGVGVNPGIYSAGGGPSGGGITAANVPGNGANGAGSSSGYPSAGGAAGIVDSTAPSVGAGATAKGTTGGSGGSGAASITTAAQSGATPGVTNYGAGGPGGGASLDGFASGAGGNGGPGYFLAITYFQ